MGLQRVRHDWATELHFKRPGGSKGKASARNVGDLGSILRLGRSPGEGNGNLFQHSCLKNSMDRGAWQATVHGVTRVGCNLVTKQQKWALGRQISFRFLYLPYWLQMGFPGCTSGKELTCQCRRCKRLGFNSWVGKIPWRTLQWFLPEESHGQRSLAGYSPWGP